MERIVYYKRVTIGGTRYTIVTPEGMTNEEFSERVNFTRRLFGHSMYPRWLCARMLLGETLDILRRKGLLKYKVKKAANALIKEFDAFERLHTMDFDEDWIEVLSGSIAMQMKPKVDALRGAMGGILLKQKIKNYILYSYPLSVIVLAKEGAEFHDALMRKIKDKYKLDFSEVFQPLRGTKVIGCLHLLMSNIEDAVGERIERGIEVSDTMVDVYLQSLARIAYDDDVIAKAFKEAQEEVNERDFNENMIAEQLSDKYKVIRV